MSETERPHAADLPVAIAAVERLLAAAAIHSDTVSLARVLELNEVLNVLEERIVEPTERLKDIDRRGLRAVVEASAKEPHADVVLHALHVSGGAGALASSADFALEGAIAERDHLRLAGRAILTALGEEDPVDAKATSIAAQLREKAASLSKRRLPPTTDPDEVLDPNWRLKPGREVPLPRLAPPPKPPPNVAAFVLKAPALDRLLLVRSGKPGRAWELPGGCVEPGETPADAAVREVVEEAGIYFRAEGGGWTVEGCEVFRGTSHASLTVPGGDVTSARWFTRSDAALLQLSDLPTAVLIRQWLGAVRRPSSEVPVPILKGLR